MPLDVLSALPARRGHFRLESGLHTAVWLTLDALFLSPRDLAPLTTALADRLRPFGATAVCGPLLGGAFLAQALATELGLRFHYSEPRPASVASGLFNAEYSFPPELLRRLRGEKVALVDDVISAGSSVRATAEALSAGGATIVVVGSLLTLGTVGIDHFGGLGIPFEALERRDFMIWNPADCPLCRAGVVLEDLARVKAGGS